MSDYSALVRELCREHFEGCISMVEYRARRTAILDRMDRELNGIDDEADRTQPNIFARAQIDD